MRKVRLPVGWPVLCEAWFKPTPVQIEALGPVHDHWPEGNGLGSEWAWGLGWECGLEVILTGYSSFDGPPPSKWYQWQASINEPNALHLADHLGWELEWQYFAARKDDLLEQARAFAVLRIEPPDGWVELGAFPTRERAVCMAARFSAKEAAHPCRIEQRRSTFVDPGLPKEMRRWAVMRQDDNGHRFLVATTPRQYPAERLARSFEQEEGALYKQTYWVEKIG